MNLTSSVVAGPYVAVTRRRPAADSPEVSSIQPRCERGSHRASLRQQSDAVCSFHFRSDLNLSTHDSLSPRLAAGGYFSNKEG